MKKSDFTYTDWDNLDKIKGEAFKKLGEHKDKIKRDDYGIIVDLGAPSYKKRLFVIDLKTGGIVRRHHVAHGVGSNKPGNKAYATRFSNVIMSKKSSLGLYVTGKTYYGKHGYSLNLHGLEESNSRAFIRRIVIHKARYVTDPYILRNGRAGNSWGCLALDPAVYKDVINLVKNGAFVYVGQ